LKDIAKEYLKVDLSTVDFNAEILNDNV